MTEPIPGLFAELEKTVAETDTALHWGSGGLPVFSTPALVGLMESAAVVALYGSLPAGQSTVGVRIDVRHLAATPVGIAVRARAELIEVDGRRLVFKIQAWDEVEIIGEASHDRFVVEESRFVEKVTAKKLNPKK